MTDTETLSGLINSAVAARMTPDFVEKEVNTRVEKLLVESIDRALRSYSDTGKLIEKAVEDALRVDRIDLPTYGSTVCTMLKAQIEARVSELVAGRLSQDMDELLSLAPKTVKLSEIAESMLDGRDPEYGHMITVELEDVREGYSRWLYLDEDEHHDIRAQYAAKHRLLIGKDGRISGGWIDQTKTEKSWTGRSYGLAQRLRAYIACGTVIELDIDYVRLGMGDY